MYIFEGIYGIYPWGQPQDTVRFMFMVDAQIQRLRIYTNSGVSKEFTFEELAKLMPRPNLRAAGGLLTALDESNGSRLTAGASLFQGMVGDSLKLGAMPAFETVAAGISAIRSSRECGKSDFSPFGGVTIDFTGVDFSGVRFKDADFSRAIVKNTDFRRATFEGCRFVGDQLKGVSLEGARIAGQELRGLDFTETVFDDAVLDGTQFYECKFPRASFKRAKINGALFLQLPMEDTVFDGAAGSAMFGGCDLSRARFVEAKLPRSGFSASTLDSASFKQADITGAAFGAVSPYPAASLGKVNFDGIIAPGAVFSGASFANATFNAAKLAGAAFNGCLLKNISFKDADLSRASFGPLGRLLAATITDVNFDGATAKGALFEGASLTKTSFKNAQLQTTAFGEATLKDVSFKDADMDDVSFASTSWPATFDRVDFDNTSLQGADFSGVNLVDTVSHARRPRLGRSVEKRTLLRKAKFRSGFLGTNWSYVDATEAIITVELKGEVDNFNASYAILPKVSFTGLNLPNANFSHAQLSGSMFRKCILDEANFTEAVLSAADFTQAKLNEAKFVRAELTGAIFTEAWLAESKFDGAVLSDVNFTGAMLAMVDFKAIEGKNLAGVTFSKAFLVKASFFNVNASRSQTRRTDFSSACLAGADFSGAFLADAVLSGAKLSAATGTINVIDVAAGPPEPFDYGKTLIDRNSTAATTLCPDGNLGVCSIDQLYANSIPASWTYGG